MSSKFIKFYRTEISAEHRIHQSSLYPSHPLVCIIGGYIWVLVKVFLPFFGPGLVCGFYWASWNGLFLVWYSWKILSASSLSYGKSPCLVCHLHCAWSHVDCTGVCAVARKGRQYSFTEKYRWKPWINAFNQYHKNVNNSVRKSELKISLKALMKLPFFFFLHETIPGFLSV